MPISRLFIGLLLISLSCQTKPKQGSGTTAAPAPPDSATVLATRPGPDAPRSAADRLIRALYFEHNKTENPFRDKDRALIDQFFAKPLADRIWAGAQQSAGKAKPAAVNPLFNAPDQGIHKAWVLPAAVAGSQAVVYVTFENKAKPEEIRIDLQQVTTGRWRITDMLYPNGKRLTQTLQVARNIGQNRAQPSYHTLAGSDDASLTHRGSLKATTKQVGFSVFSGVVLCFSELGDLLHLRFSPLHDSRDQ